ncbi:MAG: ribonuclease P protein component [Fimbriimonadales bacterium]|nr:ribonuclease P protein component [Fimbriimonadales bacterium]
MLPRAGRLRKKREFEQVYQQGRRVRTESFTMYVRAREDDAPTRMGFVVGRQFGTHAQRNRVKRRLRAAARKLWERLPAGYDVVCIARPAATTAPIEQIQRQLQSALTLTGISSTGGKP